MRKSFLYFIIASAAAVFFACSNETDAFSMPLYTDTVRYQSLARLESVEWTEALEQNALNTPAAAHSVAALPENLCAAGSRNLPAIYPVIDGFGSLDVSFLTEEQYVFIKTFCTSVCSSVLDESFFSDSAAAMLPALQYELSVWPHISSFVIGKPYSLAADDTFDGKHAAEIPVRFYFETSHADLRIFFSADEKKTDGGISHHFCVEQLQFGEIADD